MKEKAAEYVERLLDYGEERGLLDPADRVFARNALLDDLKLQAPCAAHERTTGEEIWQIMEVLLDYAAAEGIIEDGITERDLFDTRLAGHITPMPSQVRREYDAKLAEEGFAAASDWFYKFCGDNGYIRRERIARNLEWGYDTGDFGEITVTINLTKPELDPAKQAALKLIPATGYPKCQLCRENEGFAGTLRHPARQNLRVLPLTLNGEPWWFQYSPYVYFYKHCIVFSEDHSDMVIDRDSLERLTEFTDIMPGYFLGSNADLPIVGGSVMTHQHYQGGAYTLPMAKAGIREYYSNPAYKNVTCGILQWPISVVRLQGKDRAEVVAAGAGILELWRSYDEPEAGVFHETDGVPHNTVTPIARKKGDLYEVDLALRCNILSDEHPKGVFHPHAELHHIKQENIGLIEAMGLFILPGRLKKELAEVEACLTGARELPETLPESDMLAKHLPWVKELAAAYGTALTPEEAEKTVRAEVGRVCRTILEQCGVFKQDEKGLALFDSFLNKAGYTKC